MLAKTMTEENKKTLLQLALGIDNPIGYEVSESISMYYVHHKGFANAIKVLTCYCVEVIKADSSDSVKYQLLQCTRLSVCLSKYNTLIYFE